MSVLVAFATGFISAMFYFGIIEIHMEDDEDDVE